MYENGDVYNLMYKLRLMTFFYILDAESLIYWG